jgi:hypothetical protein
MCASGAVFSPPRNFHPIWVGGVDLLTIVQEAKRLDITSLWAVFIEPSVRKYSSIMWEKFDGIWSNRERCLADRAEYVYESVDFLGSFCCESKGDFSVEALHTKELRKEASERELLEGFWQTDQDEWDFRWKSKSRRLSAANAARH